MDRIVFDGFEDECVFEGEGEFRRLAFAAQGEALTELVLLSRGSPVRCLSVHEEAY